MNKISHKKEHPILDFTAAAATTTTTNSTNTNFTNSN
jgi:hypothetical protein